MARLHLPQSEAGNQILCSLPADEYSRLLPHLEPFPLAQVARLYRPCEPIRHVVFPQTGTVSLLAQMRDGVQVEVGTVGSRGLVGLPVALGTDAVPFAAVVQTSGSAHRVRAEAFREESARCGELHRLTLRYAQALFVQTAQSAACNNAHDLDQRLARWLLTAFDHARSGELEATQEFISDLVGVRRAGITVALGKYAEEGIIENPRGRVRLVDRGRLERAACECYRVIADEFDRLLGGRPGAEHPASESGHEHDSRQGGGPESPCRGGLRRHPAHDEGRA